MHQQVSQQVTQLMGKEVSRKEFLGMAGLTVVSVFGFGTVMKLLTGKSLIEAPQKSAGTGYGASAYGR